MNKCVRDVIRVSCALLFFSFELLPVTTLNNLSFVNFWLLNLTANYGIVDKIYSSVGWWINMASELWNWIANLAIRRRMLNSTPNFEIWLRILVSAGMRIGFRISSFGIFWPNPQLVDLHSEFSNCIANISSCVGNVDMACELLISTSVRIGFRISYYGCKFLGLGVHYPTPSSYFDEWINVIGLRIYMN